MRTYLFARIIITLAVALATAWFVHESRWVEVMVDEGMRGAAADDDTYTLRRLLAASGTTLEVRKALEPLPPPGATLVLNSGSWTVFPGRGERLQAWVRDGGHLVIDGMADLDDLRWLPLSFTSAKATRPPRPAPAQPASAAEPPPDSVVGRTLPRAREASGSVGPFDRPFKQDSWRWSWLPCADYTEPDDVTQPAYERGRVYRGCMYVKNLRVRPPAQATWSLVDRMNRVLAVRVPYGRGSVTAASGDLVTDNRRLLQADNGLVASALMQAAPGRVVWLVQDEAREALPLWLWHEARTPTLLLMAAVLLALWRLLPRFGPREAVPAPARRSMGEQVHGTGQFIANAEPRALHAAARQAFDAVARTRIEAWNERDDAERVAALAASLAPTITLDRATLLAAFAPPPGARPDQVLAATGVIEQARRLLLRAPVSPFAH